MGHRVNLVGVAVQSYDDPRPREKILAEAVDFLEIGGVWRYEDLDDEVTVLVPRSTVRALSVSHKEV
jgi:hypothetical protein